MLISLIGVVFSNGTMLTVLDKSDSVNECTQEISELMKLHIQGCSKMPINLLGNWLISVCHLVHQQLWPRASLMIVMMMTYVSCLTRFIAGL